MIFFYLLVTVMPLTRHPFWSDFVGDLTMVKILGGICLVCAALHLLRRRPPDWFTPWPARWFVVLALIAMASYMALGVSQPLETSPFMSYASFLILLFVTRVLVDSVVRLRYVLLAAVASVAYGSLHVIREWQNYGGMSLGYRPGWVVGDPNYYSVSALLCLPLAFCLLQTSQPGWERWLCRGSIAVTLVGLTLAASRGGLLGLVAEALLLMWRSPRRFRSFGLVVLVLLPIMVLTPASPLERLLNPSRSDQESSELRTSIWGAGLKMIEQNPLTGIGAGNFKTRVNEFGAPGETLKSVGHNTYVEIAAEMGVPALMIFFSMLVATFIALRRVQRLGGNPSSVFLAQAAKGLETGLLGFLIGAFFISAQTQKLFWLVVFLTTCLPSLARQVSEARTADKRTTVPYPALVPIIRPGGTIHTFNVSVDEGLPLSDSPTKATTS